MNESNRFRRQTYTELKKTNTEKGLKPFSLLLGEGDRKLLDEITETLTCNKTDAIRTAIRVYHALMTK